MKLIENTGVGDHISCSFRIDPATSGTESPWRFNDSKAWPEKVGNSTHESRSHFASYNGQKYTIITALPTRIEGKYPVGPGNAAHVITLAIALTRSYVPKYT